jgi:farnesyl diphosphate synthase
VASSTYDQGCVDVSATSVATPARAFFELEETWAATAVGIEETLGKLMPRPQGRHLRVQEAMSYAVFTRGKRLRPFLLVQCADLFGVPRRMALRAAAAIEFVHTYSLIHDDLPCMDDDALRRGHPTVHVKFDEATAVLAGDALLTLSFEVLAAEDTHPSAETRSLLVKGLAEASGSNGLVGGQMCDMLAPEVHFSPEDIVTLQRMKTGALFEFTCEAGAILGNASGAERKRLRNYARDLGLAFQIADDLIDVTGSMEKAGKAVGKDRARGKATLLSVFGHEGARRKAQLLTEQAVDALALFGKEADVLRCLPRYLMDRQA